MAERNAGSAAIRIRPDATKFVADLKRELASKNAEFVMQVSADTGQAKADIARFRQQQSRDGMKVGVDVGLGQAEADLKAFRARQRANGMVIKVDAETGDANRKLGEINKHLESFRRSDFLRLNLGAGLVAGIQPAVAGLAQVAAGLQQVVQAGIAVPGVMAAASASIGTLVLGLSGIKDAWDAVSAASESAGKDQAAQARASAAASNQLRNAVVDEAQARKDVARATRDAKNELRDLRVEQQGGMIDESRAILEAVKAREDLARGNFTDIRDQMLRVAEADQRVIESRSRNLQTQERLNDANAKGIAGSDQVVAANERHIRSQQQLADAQMASAEAGSAMSAAQEKAAQELAKHGPNAQALVQTLERMKPAFLDLRSAAAEPLLAGKAEEFERFFNTISPNIKNGIGNIAKGWNSNISALFDSVGSDTGRGLIDRILGNTGEAQARASAAIDPIVQGLGTLTAAGSDVVPRLVDGLTAVSDRFRDFIVQADQDGRLDKWINDGIDGSRMLGESVLNIGKAFTGITKAVGGGRGFLEWLQQATGRLQTFLNSTEGQNKLREYFEQGRDMMREFMPLLQELPGLFRAVGEGASTYVGGLLPILKEAAEFLGDHPNLVKTAVAAYLAWNTVKPIMGTVMNSLNLLNTGLIGIGTNFAGTRARVNDEMGKVNKAFDDAGKPSSKLATFSSRIAGLGAVGGPIGILAATAIPGLITALQALDSQSQLSAEKTDYLNSRQLALEETLDRVTGKLTGQTLDSQINAAQNYDPGGNGGNIPGISKGDALAAAVKLGIAPDLYAQSLIGDKAAQDQIRDVLIKNNLLPEFTANPELAKTAAEIKNLTSGKVTQDDLINALIGAPGAAEKYTAALREGALANSGGDQAMADATISQYNLAGIAQRLSATGQASVLAGGAMTTLSSALPSGDPTRQANQARNGRFRVTAAGAGVIGVPAGTEAGSLGPGQGFQVSSPNPVPPNNQGVTSKQDADGSWTITVPPGAMIEEYKKGGATPGGRDQGFLAMLHGQEWVHDAPTVDRYGPDVMNAMRSGKIDPNALRGLLPGFWSGGPTDPNDPNAHQGTGAPPGPAPVAPNPFSGSGINGILGNIVSGIQGPINNGMGLLNTFGQASPGQAFGSNLLSGVVPGLSLPGAGGGTGATGLIPGLPGLLQAGSDPAMQQAWFGQTGDWLANWGASTLLKFGGTLLNGALGFFGAEGLMQNPIVQGIGQGASHFAGLAGQLSAPAGMANIPFNSLGNLDPATLQALFGPAGAPEGLGGTSVPALNPSILQALFGGGSTVAVDAAPGQLTSLPTRIGAENGLQINTINVKRAVEAVFPQITDIGGYRQDALKWHPNGLAIDVMIPGQGGNNDPTTPEGLALGNQIYQYVMANKEQFGVDYIMWQEKDHYNHLHINTTGGGYPGSGGAPGGSGPIKAAVPQFAAGGPTPAGRKRAFPALLHGDEWVHDAGTVGLYGRDVMDAIWKHKVDPVALRALIPQFAYGGPTAEQIRAAYGVPTPPPRPRPVVPDAKKIMPSAPIKQLPAPIADPRVPAAGPPPVAQPAPAGPPPAPARGVPVFVPGPGDGVAPPGPTDHTLPWINQAIDSGASAIGQALSTALGVAGGAAGGFGGSAAGALGPYAAGAVMQGGKIIKGIANVVSSSLVGSVPGSFTTTPEAYGRTMRSEQNVPQTAPTSVTNVGGIYGHDTWQVFQELDMRQSQANQAAMAHRRTR
jgi:hypothetical protein